MSAFFIHRSNRLERLVDALTVLLREPVSGPFDPDAVVVQGRGMEIWLGGELARRFEVWATRMQYPRGFIERLAREVVGDDAPEGPPLSEDLIGWAVLAALPALIEREEFVTLARYVEGDATGVRRAELATRIATVFDQYLTYRPDWIRQWEAGEAGGVPESDRWQPVLWRAVSERARTPHLGVAIERLVERLRSGEPVAGLPPRLLTFGLSALPPAYLRVWAALSLHVDVHVFSFSPSPGLSPPPWRPAGPGHGKPALDVPSPLVASLGSLGAEFDDVLRAALTECGATVRDQPCYERPAGDGLLQRLGAALYELSAPPEPGLAPRDDAAIVIHSCHGPLREVEVLRDQLLALLTRSEPRVLPEEVAVLVPDLETYAPLIEAVFAREPGQPDFIPYHVSDRSERHGSPVLDGLLRVMQLVRGRVTASSVFDVLALEPVARRFELDTAAIEALRGWVSESGVRWGIDAEHRGARGLPRDDANTWRFGLRRLLLGYALPGQGQRLFEGVLPFDEIEGKDAALLGRLGWFTRTLFDSIAELERGRTLGQWCATLDALGESLFAAGADTARQLGRVSRVLARASEQAAAVGFDGAVDVAVIASLLERAASAAGAERGFLSGGVTFCALVPMRSIPFRVIALLGMNDGDFPRSPRPTEMDLIRSGKLPRRPGDRSRRDDDRHLFLETLCAARERLIITYTGQSVRDDRPRPPSVCVSELLDTVAERVVEHPLQGFSPRYFAGLEPELFSFSPEYAAAASKLLAARRETRPFITRALARPESSEIRLDELVKFFKSPAAYFLNRRLGLYLAEDDRALSDREPLELDELERWKLGDTLVSHLLTDVPLDCSEQLLRAAGQLPLGNTGQLELEQLVERCQRITELTREHRGGSALGPLALRVPVAAGVVMGVASNRFTAAAVTHRYSTVRPKYELEAWIRHVAQCCVPGAAQPAVLIGRSGEAAKAVKWRPLLPGEAQQALEGLVELYREGQQGPLPFLPDTSARYHATGSGTEAGVAAAVAAFESERGETAYDPHPARAFGGLLPPFDAAYDAGERALDETRFHAVALAVYQPLCEART